MNNQLLHLNVGSFSLHFVRYSNLILNLFSLMVDANIPDIALEPDKTVKKVGLLNVQDVKKCNKKKG